MLEKLAYYCDEHFLDYGEENFNMSKYALIMILNQIYHFIYNLTKCDNVYPILP